jgi:glycosyltransferase involved in cell wall biosynthesis
MSLLTIVIPAFNESDYILITLGRIQKTVRTDFECLVVVDSLDDSTISHVSNLSKSDPRFQIILNDLGKGPAFAMKKGIYNANGNFIAIVSGDGSDDVSQIDDLVRLVERGVSVAVASRHMKGGQLVGSPFLKGLLSKVAGLSLFHISRVGTHDSTNNFKVYDKTFLNSIVIESIHGFELGLELICKAKHQKLRVAEIPTIWIERSEGVSKFPLVRSLPKYIFWYLKTIFKF